MIEYFKKTRVTMIFIFLCSLSVLVYARHYDVINHLDNKYLYEYCVVLFRVILCIILLNILNKFIFNKEEEYPKYNCVTPFLITYITECIIIVLLLLNKITITKLNGIIIDMFLMLLMLFSSCVCKIKVSNFVRKIKLTEIVVIIFIFLVYFTPNVLLHGKLAFRYHNYGYASILAYLIQLIWLFIYPGFFEEFLFRGLLISKLKNYSSNEQIINIIQSILFGVIHYNQYIQYVSLWFAILATGTQILLGYILGSIYLKTKSLVPCIIFHVLLDWV